MIAGQTRRNMRAMCSSRGGGLYTFKRNERCYMENVPDSANSRKWILFLSENGKSPYVAYAGRSVQIDKRWARMIMLLKEAQAADERLPDSLQGFRNATELGKVYDGNPEIIYPKETMTAYLSQLCLRLEEPVANCAAFPELIARIKNRGAKLLYPVEIQIFDAIPAPCPPSVESGEAVPPVADPRASAHKPKKIRRRRRAGSDSA